MSGDKLKKLISGAPAGPGIYIFTDADNKKLYIGKASNIKARLSSYLKTSDHRILQMLSRATDIKTFETDSEIEALIMESQQIKRHQPSFNIMLRDDKQFFYVVFSNGNFPKISITHQPRQDTDFVGPFTDGTALKTTLRYLRKAFPYCACKKPHNNFCLNYHIGKCAGFCCLKKTELSIEYKVLREYKKNIKALKNILSGKKILVIKSIEKEMKTTAKKGGLQKAIELRRKLKSIKRVFDNAKILNTKYLILNTKTEKESSYPLKQLTRIVGMNRLPRRIEGYDIAHIQGKYAVGAMTVFTLQQSSGQVDYNPDKNEYRKFKIYTKNTPDDTAMLKEILIRRFNHPEWPMPDLILIDGGKAQLNTAHKIVKNIPIIALTKNEKHLGVKFFVTGKKNPISLSKIPADVKNLLLRIDSEAHRFAISYYRQLHERAGLGLSSN